MDRIFWINLLKKHNNWKENMQVNSTEELKNIVKHFEKIRDDEEYTLKIIKYNLIN